MISENPFDKFREECNTSLADALKKTLPEIKIEKLTLSKPPRIDFGQLSSSLCFEVARKVRQKPIALAEHLANSFCESSFSLIEKVVAAGGGYVNFYANFGKFSNVSLCTFTASSFPREYTSRSL